MTISPDFTPLSSLTGGLVIGLAATLFLFSTGRVAGISGIAKGIRFDRDAFWRLSFLSGLVLGGLLIAWIYPAAKASSEALNALSPLYLISAGLLVGLGTGIGNGFTSGHGVCGLARFSRRSLLATLIFMASGMLTVWILRH